MTYFINNIAFLMRRYADHYIDQLIARSDYGSMVDLQGILMSGTDVTLEKSNYGLPPVAFLFVETIHWFAQSIRSGTWTYFESTAEERQSAMYQALESLAPSGFAERYKYGSENWRAPEKMKALDVWINESDDACVLWLSEFQRENRSVFWPLYA